MSAVCHGNGPEHCCTIQGETCEFLEENTVEGRRWACGLYRQHGSWDAVYATSEYEGVRVKLRKANIALDCGDWPQVDPVLEAKIRSGECHPNAACCWGEKWLT